MSEEIKKGAQDIDLAQKDLDQISGGVLINESSEEKDRKTTDKSAGDIVLPEI